MNNKNTTEYKPKTYADGYQIQYKDFYGRGDKKYGVYPPMWDDKHGNPPLLGIVFADNEFLAERLAYDRGLSPCQSLPPKLRFLGQVKKTFNSVT